MEKLSIILPVYNAEKTIERAINSVLNQNKHDLNYELIIINDGSVDKTEEILKNYKKYSQIKVLNQSNKGVSEARNRGLREADGEYIIFLDADDYFSLDLFNNLRDIGNIDFILLGYQVLQEDSKYMYYKITSKNKIFEKRQNIVLLRHMCGKMYNTQLLKDNNIRFKTEITYGEDYLFTLDYLRKISNLKVIDKVVYFIDKSNENSLSNQKIENYNKLTEMIFLNVLAEEYTDSSKTNIIVDEIVANIRHDIQNGKQVASIYRKIENILKNLVDINFIMNKENKFVTNFIIILLKLKQNKLLVYLLIFKYKIFSRNS